GERHVGARPKHQRVALVSYTRHFASPELDGSDWLTIWVYSVNEWLTTAELLSRISEGCDRFEKSMLGVEDLARTLAPRANGLRSDFQVWPKGKFRVAVRNVASWPIADATLSDSRGSFWGKSGHPA
ncbi:MAG: hypothetical protein WBE48_13910, partial [Xanthobacteraceae bacterium]